MRPQISIRNLSVTYFKGKSNEVRALNSINLDIYPGEFIVFFGPSGCGKSTLLYSIAGLERGIEGEIKIDEQSLLVMTSKQLAQYHQKKIGMVFQAYYLIPSLSVVENVELPQMAIGGLRAVRRKKAEDLLEHFGVGKQKSKLPQELSGGQQQRVAICRALINDPDIILADEPVGNLDSKSALDVMELLAKLNSEQKKTVLLVTHDPTHLHMADRVYYLKDGKHHDTKVNKPTKYYQVQKGVPVPKELELLSQSYGALREIKDTTSLELFKSKHIISQVLTGFSVAEIEGLEERVEQLLSSGTGDLTYIYSYLDKNSREGGLDMDKRSAQKISQEIADIAHKIHTLFKQSGDNIEQVRQISDYLMEHFKLNFETVNEKNIFDNLIVARLQNKIAINQVQSILDKNLIAGGLGLESRLAHKVAKRLELLMLGRYQLTVIPDRKNLTLIDRPTEPNEETKTQ